MTEQRVCLTPLSPSPLSIKIKTKDQLYNEGSELLVSQKYEQALVFYNKFLKRYPNQSYAYSNFSFALMKLQKYQQSINTSKKALQIDPKNEYAYQYLGQSYQQKGNNQQAIKYYKKALQINPKNYNVYIKIASIYQNQEKYKQQEQICNILIKLDPNNLQGYRSLGMALTNLQKYNQALDVYYKILQKYPEDYRSYFRLGAIYLELLQFDKSIEATKKGIPFFQKGIPLFQKDAKMSKIKKKFFANAYHFLGAALMLNHQYKQSEQYFLKTIQINPRKFQAYKNLSQVYSKLNQKQKILKPIQKLMQLQPNNAQTFLTVGDCFYNLNTYNQAIKGYKRCIKLDPKNYESHFQLGNIFRDLNKEKQAIQHFQKAIQLEPKKLKSYHNLGLVYYRMKKQQQAIKYLNKVLQIQPNYLMTLTSLGNIYLKRNQIKEAQQLFQRIRKQISKPFYEKMDLKKLQKIDLNQNQFNFIKQSLKVFENTQKQLKILNQNKNKSKNKQAQKLVQKFQVFANNKIIQLLDTQNVSKLQKNQNANDLNKVQQIKSEIHQQFLAMKKRISELENRVKIVQQKMTTKQQIEQIYKNMEINKKDVIEKIQKLQKYYKPMKDLEQKIQFLKKNNKLKLARYAQTLFWVLNTHINSYRMLSQGIVQKGGNVEQGRVGGVVKKLSTILGLAQDVPVIGSACATVKKIAQKYADASQDMIITKISSYFSDLWNERKISDSVSQVTLTIIDSPYYAQMIQKSKIQEKGLFDILEIIEQVRDQIISEIEDVQLKNKKIEQIYAITDCSFIIKNIIRLTKKDIQQHKAKYETQDCLLPLAYLLIESRTIQQKKQIQNQNTNKKQTQPCCKIM